MALETFAELGMILPQVSAESRCQLLDYVERHPDMLQNDQRW